MAGRPVFQGVMDCTRTSLGGNRDNPMGHSLGSGDVPVKIGKSQILYTKFSHLILKIQHLEVLNKNYIIYNIIYLLFALCMYV